MGIQQRLMDEQILLKMYIHLAEFYGNRAHHNKLKGTYEDPIYGRYEMKDVQRHIYLLEGIHTEIKLIENNVFINIELDTNTNTLSL